MSDGSKIDWCDATINPLGWGCYGPGGTAEKPNRCPYCFAYRRAKRNMRDCPQCNAFEPHWHPEQLEKLLHWKKPRRIFVQSMGDLFGRTVTSQQRQAVMQAVCEHSRHTFLMLTKETERMRDAMSTWNVPTFPNLWLGTSITNQQDANERIPWLLKTPAAVRWLSIEPLLGPVDEIHGVWRNHALPATARVQWVVVGSQTGHGTVAPKRQWVTSIIDQCKASGVPVWVKDNISNGWLEPYGVSHMRELPEAKP